MEFAYDFPIIFGICLFLFIFVSAVSIVIFVALIMSRIYVDTCNNTVKQFIWLKEQNNGGIGQTQLYSENKRYWIYHKWVCSDDWDSLKLGECVGAKWIGQDGNTLQSLAKVLGKYRYDGEGLGETPKCWIPRFVIVIGLIKCPACKENTIKLPERKCYVCHTEFNVAKKWGIWWGKGFGNHFNYKEKLAMRKEQEKESPE